ncbi:MAG: YraN family protein [Oscillatoriales cyanobacterium CG2_30_44_21]|nr:MAG: YraN family protein [Oscillatoriales cyanobacterium CG2_30_44_21]
MSKEVGDRGEMLVAKLLKDSGWQILATQWRCRWGEIDLVACDRQWLIFVEVKTRGIHNLDADGSLAITPKKQAKLIKTALTFLDMHPQLSELACRFDVALVRYQKNINSFDNASKLGVSPETPANHIYLQDYIEQAFVAY